VAELGRQDELQQMLDHIRQNVPAVRSVSVELAEQYATGTETGITLVVLVAASPEEVYAADKQLSRWEIQTFSPDVKQYFTTLLVPVPSHGW
jgi:hypothetical protein